MRRELCSYRRGPTIYTPVKRTNRLGKKHTMSRMQFADFTLQFVDFPPRIIHVYTRAPIHASSLLTPPIPHIPLSPSPRPPQGLHPLSTSQPPPPHSSGPAPPAAHDSTQMRKSVPAPGTTSGHWLALSGTSAGVRGRTLSGFGPRSGGRLR